MMRETNPGRSQDSEVAAKLSSAPAANLGCNVALAGWLAADMVRIWLFAGEEFDNGWRELAEIVILGLAAVMVLLRSPPQRSDASPGTVAIALAAMLLPLLYAEAGEMAAPSQAVIVAQVCALAVMGWATFSLGTNFSVLPHFRSLVTAGPYGLVRHPLYASYLLFDGTIVIGMASAPAVALWLAEFALLANRARREERTLIESDAAYRRYAAAVPYRLFPFLL